MGMSSMVGFRMFVLFWDSVGMVRAQCEAHMLSHLAAWCYLNQHQ